MSLELWSSLPAFTLVRSQTPTVNVIPYTPLIITGYVTAHNTLWGSKCTAFNGSIVEEMLDEQRLICLNDGNGIGLDIVHGQESVLDLTLVCVWKRYVWKSLWEILKELGRILAETVTLLTVILE